MNKYGWGAVALLFASACTNPATGPNDQAGPEVSEAVVIPRTDVDAQRKLSAPADSIYARLYAMLNDTNQWTFTEGLTADPVQRTLKGRRTVALPFQVVSGERSFSGTKALTYDLEVSCQEDRFRVRTARAMVDGEPAKHPEFWTDRIPSGPYPKNVDDRNQRLWNEMLWYQVHNNAMRHLNAVADQLYGRAFALPGSH